jgi:predicted nucleic acid-binding protein
MGSKPRVLFDVNVILDVLQERQPFFDDSFRLLSYAETGRIEGWVSAHTITTLYYLIAKDKSEAQAKVLLTQLLQYLHVANIDQMTIETALNLPYRDFEDAVQAIAATQQKLDYLVTRNPKDYQPEIIPTLQPAELIAIL